MAKFSLSKLCEWVILAKGKVTKTGLSSVSGALGRTDNTVGRVRGLALNMTDDTPGGYVKLGVKTAMPPGGSAARHGQVGKYCECDRLYKLIDAFHIDHIVRWWRACKATKAPGYMPYMTWIKVCCLALPEKEFFVRHAWYGRWVCTNDTATEFVMWFVTLRGMKRPMRNPLDCVVCLLNQDKTVNSLLLPESATDTTVSFYLPILPASSHVYIDVYWLVNPPPGWGA
jgi:hypothetical protein